MALVEEYYELNEAEEVSVVWKVLQILFYIFAGCFGLWCGYTIALLRLKFNDKCYLFTSIKTTKGEKLGSDYISWENDSWCDYCQYSMVSSFIVATIWATFFLMCGKGGKSLTGLPQPWRIVWPSFIFNFIYFMVSLSTAVNIQQGTELFCTNPTQRPAPGRRAIDHCAPLMILPLQDVHITSLQLEIVTKTSWACVVSWLILFLISAARIIFVIDFNMYKICVFKIGEIVHNKKEEVLRVTNYEEPRKIHFDGVNNRMLSIQFDDRFEDKNRKGKTNKRLMPIQPNAAFYVTTDIRQLNREKQRKKSFRLLDSAFDGHATNVGIKQMSKHIKLAAFDVSRVPSPSRQLNSRDPANSLQERSEDSDDSFLYAMGSIRNRNGSENNVNHDENELEDFGEDDLRKHKKRI